jgi:transposase
MFGAIEFQSGRFIFMETPEKFNGDSYLQFIRHLLDSSSAPVILIEDGAPYHRSSKVREFQKDMEGKGLLFTYRLPSFSPDFNPIEKLWRNTKKNAKRLKYFKTFDALRESVLAAFGKYMGNAAEVIRVMKKLRSSAELQLLVDSFSGK